MSRIKGADPGWKGSGAAFGAVVSQLTPGGAHCWDACAVPINASSLSARRRRCGVTGRAQAEAHAHSLLRLFPVFPG